jgi:hypothetical protein
VLSPFAVWLHGQTRRPDTVGMAARVVCASPWLRWENTIHLHRLLDAFPEDSTERFAVKLAHREWRRVQADLRNGAKAS